MIKYFIFERRFIMNAKKIALGLAKLSTIGGAIGGVLYLSNKKLKKEKDLNKRFTTYYTATNQWLMNKNENKYVGDYFKENAYKTIAIYGMGTMAELFYNELKNSNSEVKVLYFVDKNAEELYYGLDDISVVGLEDVSSQEEVDAIIVTPIYDFDNINEDLEKLGVNADIISLEDILYEI